MLNQIALVEKWSERLDNTQPIGGNVERVVLCYVIERELYTTTTEKQTSRANL